MAWSKYGKNVVRFFHGQRFQLASRRCSRGRKASARAGRNVESRGTWPRGPFLGCPDPNFLWPPLLDFLDYKYPFFIAMNYLQLG